MSTKTAQRDDRKVMIATLTKVWPQAKLGRVKNDDLIWLGLVAQHLQPSKRDMSGTLRKYREMPDHYKPTVAYSGRQSLSIGDTVAEFLDGMSPAEVLKAAERILGLEDDELTTKYAHLNPGQQRMNGGNRIRAALKRGDIKADDLH